MLVKWDPVTLPPPSCRACYQAEGSVHPGDGGECPDLPGPEDRVLEATEAHVRTQEGEGDETLQAFPDAIHHNKISFFFFLASVHFKKREGGKEKRVSGMGWGVGWEGGDKRNILYGCLHDEMVKLPIRNR